jgi:hypothetical protein
MKKIVFSALLAASVLSCVKRDDVAPVTTNALSPIAEADLPPKTHTITDYNSDGTNSPARSFNSTYADANKLIGTTRSTGEVVSTITYTGDFITTEKTESTNTYEYKDGKISRKINLKQDGTQTTQDYVYDQAKISSIVLKDAKGTITNEYKFVHNADGTITQTNTLQQGTKTTLTIVNGNLVKKVEETPYNISTQDYTFDTKIDPLHKIKNLALIRATDKPENALVKNKNVMLTAKIINKDLVNPTSAPSPFDRDDVYTNTYDSLGRLTKQIKTNNGKVSKVEDFTY